MMSNAVPIPKHQPRKWIVAAGITLVALSIALQGQFQLPQHATWASVLIVLLDSGAHVAAMWLAAIGFGCPIVQRLRRDPHRMHLGIIEAGLGMAFILTVNWIAATLGILNIVTAWAFIGLGILLAIAHAMHRAHPMRISDPPWLTILALPAAALILVATLCPPSTIWAVEAYGYDVLSYHMQLPREWLELGVMTGLDHNVYSYLPSLVESAYTLIATMRGQTVSSIYACQIFHASLGGYFIIALGLTLRQLGFERAAWFGPVMVMTTPWFIITSASAYNEMGVLAFTGLALLLLFQPTRPTPYAATLAGFALGLATLAKLTAGVMIVIPIIIAVALRLHHHVRWQSAPNRRQTATIASVVALGGLLAIAPYLVRNTIWTGNPVFPMATSVFGSAHWTPELTKRWHDAHGPNAYQIRDGLSLTTQWLSNRGYSAIGGSPQKRDSRNVARFDLANGFPLFWIIAFAGATLGIFWRRARKLTLAMILMLGVQLLFWWFATHHQSRFLIPTLIPAAIFLGIGASRLEMLIERHAGYLFPIILTAFVLTSITIAYRSVFSQTIPLNNGQRAPMWMLIDSLPRLDMIDNTPAPVGDHELNHGPTASGKTYLVADNSRLLYIRAPFTYQSAFDNNTLGDAMRLGDATAYLKRTGHTHVWVHHSELNRLHNTYGFDPAVTSASIANLAQRDHWQIEKQIANTITLYRLP